MKVVTKWKLASHKIDVNITSKHTTLNITSQETQQNRYTAAALCSSLKRCHLQDKCCPHSAFQTTHPKTVCYSTFTQQ